MNPTFSLSAAEAPLPMPPASKSAAAAAKSFFLIVNLQTAGGTTVQDAAPHRAHPVFESAIGHEHGAQGGRRSRAAGFGTRNQHEDDDRCEIGQRRHELRRNSDAG